MKYPRLETITRTLLLAFAAILLFLGSAGTAKADTTTTIPDCGYLNGRPCTPFDNEAYNIYFGFSTQCDFGLYVNIHNKCVSNSRDTLSGKPGTWVQWALMEQRNGVGANVPVNMVTTFGTHNSYSSYGDGFQSIISVDQKLSIYDQLEAGARVIRLDPWYYFDNMRVCHASDDVRQCSILSPIVIFSLEAALPLLYTWFPGIGIAAPVEAVNSPGRLFSYAVKEVADWLDKNPNEFIIIQMNLQDWHRENAYLATEPIRQYIGRDRIYTPADWQADHNASSTTAPSTLYQLPTMDQMRKTKHKQVMILAGGEIGPYAAGNVNNYPSELAFHGGESTHASNFVFGAGHTTSDFGACLAGPTPDGTAALPYWQTSDGGLVYNNVGTFYHIGEDRSLSTSISGKNPDGYLNTVEVQTAAQCGMSLIAVDFLLHQELSQSPASGAKPDVGTDKRREAAIWSFDENDMGTNGPALMKSNGRWTSDHIQNLHHYACAKSDWGWPRTFQDQNKVKITRVAGPFANGQQACTSEYPGYNFFAPSTGPQNRLLLVEYNTIDTTSSQIRGAGGVWLNYISTTSNLLSLGQTDVSFSVDLPNPGAMSQTFTIYGPPGVTLLAPALYGSGTSPIFVDNPGAITLDSLGRATVTLNFRPQAVAGLNAGLYNDKLLFVYSDPSHTNAILSTAILNIDLNASSSDTVTISSASCSNSVCTGAEGVPFSLFLNISRPTPGLVPITGTLELREPFTTIDNVTSVNKVAGPLTYQNLFIQGVGYQSALGNTPITLPPGSHQVAAYYSGGLIDSAVVSNKLTINIGSFFNPSPAVVNMISDGSGASLTQAITIHNPGNNGLQVTATCGGSLANCWLSGSGSGNTVTLRTTSALNNLAAGKYDAVVAIADGTHATVSVPVHLTATGKLTLSTTRLSLLTGSGPVSAVVTGTINGSPVPIKGKVSSGAYFTASDGTITANAQGLPVGFRASGTVDFYSDFAVAPVSVDVQLQVAATTIITTNPPGLAFTVDGTTYTTAQNFVWATPSTHTLSVNPLTTGLNSQYLFSKWSDSGAATHGIPAPATSGTITATFDQAFPLTAQALPAGAGTLTLQPAAEQGLYRAGTPVTLSAYPAPGQAFSGFRGDLNGVTNPGTLIIDQPKTVVGNFIASLPSLYALPAAADHSGTPVTVSVQLANKGTGAATNAQILSVSGIKVLIGTGTVTPLTQTATLGNIAPGATSTPGVLSFDWPDSATRVQFTVNFGDASGYRGSTTLAIIR